ncbi:MAG: hypothetical protein H7138_25935, partial [Myxococcales bacterium]|nr:hypothetical protein [Myxococcales bacterium]
VARWRSSVFEAYAATIERPSAAKTRVVKLPAELAATDDEIFLYQVGGEARRIGSARDAQLTYVPWTRGVYWALACRPTECFVIAAVRAL